MSDLSHVLAADPAVDLRVLEAMAGELEAYILGEDALRMIFVRLDGGEQRMSMSGGDMLSRLHRLQSVRAELPLSLQERLEVVEQKVRDTIYSLRTRFQVRLAQEMKGRLDSLRWYLDDLAEDRARGRANYPYEIRNRQRIEEILKELGTSLAPELAERLREVDRRLRMTVRGGGFIWDERLQSAFPAQPYWYLYGMP